VGVVPQLKSDPHFEGAPDISSRDSARLTVGEIEDLLLRGEIEGGELVPRGSNYTFVVQLRADKTPFLGIYKPASGERPLWDFPYGTLHHRERCSFLVSQALGWHLIPPTVIRDGPHGEGSMQLFISHDDGSNYFSLREEGRPELFLISVFDFIVNNTDRKGGHCFKGEDGRVWAIDHGLTFHAQPKLRTVIWDYSGQNLPENLVGDLKRLDRQLAEKDNPLCREISSLLDGEEVKVFRKRVKAFLKNPRLPHPEEYRSFPWPQV
jgi:hypothetical protein